MIDPFKNNLIENAKVTIEQNYNKDINFLENYKLKIINKRLDNIFNISYIVNNNVIAQEEKIKKFYKEYNQIIEELEIQLQDKIIEQVEFEKLCKESLEKFNSYYHNKIEKINAKIKKYREKNENLINLKKKNYKLKNKVFTELIDKKILKVNIKKNKKIEKLILPNNKIIVELENKLIKKKKNKLLISKEYQTIVDINEDLKNGKIGQIKFNQQMEILNPQLDNRITKIENTQTFKIRKFNKSVKLTNTNSHWRREKIKEGFITLLNQSKLVLLILIISIVAGLSNPYFFTERTWVNLLTNNLDLLLVAFGMTLIILTGGIDLSVGSVLAFSGAITIKLLEANLTIFLAIIIGLLAACLFGFIAGFLISFVKLQPFIVTLVLMLSLRGATALLLESKATALPQDTLQWITQPVIGKMPWSFFIGLIIFVMLFILMKWYQYGRYVYAVGGNEKAAYLSGIKTNFIKTSVYVFSGALVYCGTLIYISKLNSISPTSGNQLELDAIACVALGGTSLLGGKGGISKTLIGWFVTCVLNTAMNMIGIDSYWQMIVKGVIILIAVVSDKQFNIVSKMERIYLNFRFKLYGG
ncbi:ABC transporter permease [Spiroplasma endosymbiont of Dioctria linearis]|uniref:ABC transporter permease n=1 Tax=Spiroplasma endosymbiont of Dioctria linearis TaxID=3066290 RepID=UPI00313ECADC